MQALNRLAAAALAERIRSRAATSEQAVTQCIARIRDRDDVVHAWVDFDADRALAEARSRDKAPVQGLLHGVPVGVKDIIDTADMPTQMGSPLYKGHQPASDASCVALLRRAGAVILGKTVTAEFAHSAPGITANPLNPAHTPGGSSSGSAAAVADFMAPLALGTQTGGSTIRPASFCGVVGFKPTFGRINRTGVKPGAESLDTIGLIARSVEDVELMARVLMGRTSLAGLGNAGPRIGLCRTHLWDTALPESQAAFEDACARLESGGARVCRTALPEHFSKLSRARVVLSNYERARAMAHEWNHGRERLSAPMRDAIAEGLEISDDEHIGTLQFAIACRRELGSVFEGIDVLLAPCVSGEAPKGLQTTGDTRLQDVWTVLHTPALTLPTHKGPNGLPIGIQLIAPLYRDEMLLEAARWVSQRYNTRMK